jgi:hypothetical protein
MSLASQVVAGTVLLALAATVSAGEIIDRVLAVVSGRIITLSDARAAVRLGLVPVEGTAEPVAEALQRLIDRRLMLAEIERYAQPEPPADALEQAVARIRNRFADDQAFERALTETGASMEELRRFVRDTLRIESYQQQRFGSMVQPTDEEVARFYRDHQDAFTVAGVRQPLEAVRDEVRERVIETRRDALVGEWLEGLRRRGDVVVLHSGAVL